LRAAPAAVGSELRELCGVRAALQLLLQCKPELIRGGALRVVCDNQGVRDSCSTLGSSKPHILRVILDIWRLRFEADCYLLFEWRPRSDPLIRSVDALSKVYDDTDWSCEAFMEVCQFFGVCPALDVFASEYTHKCARFFSRYWCTGSAGVDAMSHSWKVPGAETGGCWIHPPFALLSQVVARIVRDKVACILVFPAWTCPWRSVIEGHALPPLFDFSRALTQPAFSPSPRVNVAETGAHWRSHMLAARFEFGKS
jgi:hypothetical protein